MNWVAPCTIKSDDLELQASTASVLLSQGDAAIGLMLCPLFSYRRGGVLQEELKIYNMLTKKNLNVDKSFSLLYKAESRSDARDARPASYSGRLVMANHVKESDNLFRGSRIFQYGYTDMAEQLASKDMVTVEAPIRPSLQIACFNVVWTTCLSVVWHSASHLRSPCDRSECAGPQDLDPEALPVTVDDTASVTVQGAKRFEQIGPDAADKLLDGIISGSEVVKGRSAVIVVDVHVGVGNLFDGFLSRRRGSSVPCFYFGAGEDTTTLEWLRKTKRDQISELFADDKIVVPGHVKAPKASALRLLWNIRPDVLTPEHCTFQTPPAPQRCSLNQGPTGHLVGERSCEAHLEPPRH